VLDRAKMMIHDGDGGVTIAPAQGGDNLAMLVDGATATKFPMSKKSSRVDFACRAMRQAIIEQALPPGTKLPEDELGTRFGMSRTLVRAALAHLQSEGLVDAPPRRTATTAKPTLDEAKEVFEVRRMLEREVVRLVIARWRPQFGAELEGHVREEEAARKAGEGRVSIRLAGEFHIKLGEMSGNNLLRRYLGEVVSRCDRTTAFSAGRGVPIRTPLPPGR
jgi:DNA-binding GntR family transcriptional regulator